MYVLGFGSVLAGATGIHMGVWILGLFLVNVIMLRKETLDATIASAVLVGTATLLLVVVITLVALVNVDPANLAAGRLLSGQPLDALSLGLVFGILLTAFFGHTSAANASKLVLTLEPSGRSLLWGGLAALATVIVLYCVAAVAILGVLGPEPLVATHGTALTPLGEAIPVVHVLGSLYVLLAVGIGSLYVTLGLYNQVIELLPKPSATARGRLAGMAANPRGRRVIGFAPAAAVCLALEVVVLFGQASFAGPIGIGGALLVPVITGVFPMLLVMAARRKGEYVPRGSLGLFGHPLVASLTALFAVVVALHCLVIWDGPVERAAAVVVSVVIVVLVAWTWRSGAFRSRAVVEPLRDRRTRDTTLSVTAGGHALLHEQPVEGSMPERATARVPAGPWRQLRVWPHEVSADGWSSHLDADIHVDGQPVTADDRQADGVVPIAGTATRVDVILPGTASG